MAEPEHLRNSEVGRYDSVKGTTLKVYRFVYKAGKPVRVNDIQRGLGLSSPSVAEYHVKKLLGFGLLREEAEGFAVDKVIWSNVVRFRRTSIPVQAAYTAFFAASLVVIVTLFRPSSISAAYFFTLMVVSVGIVISLYESYKTLKSL
jgi:hypothetical protein